LIFALDTFVSQGFGARKPQNTNWKTKKFFVSSSFLLCV
jgi:hypothetical protein